MELLRHFTHCPRCTQSLPQPPAAPNYFDCPACQFRCYFNPAVAVAGFIARADGRMLFIRRAKDPARGRLAPPGGFVDADETAEDAVQREIREEVGLEIEGLEFLCSHPNRYLYREVTYTVLDFFFTARARTTQGVTDYTEVESFLWLDPLEVQPSDMAFPSMQAALALLQARLRRSK